MDQRSLLTAICLAFASHLCVAQEEYKAPQPAVDTEEANKNPPPTDPRDFSGVWWTRGYDRTFRPVSDPPMKPAEAVKLLPLTPQEAANRQHHLDMEKAGTPIADAP